MLELVPLMQCWCIAKHNIKCDDLIDTISGMNAGAKGVPTAEEAVLAMYTNNQGLLSFPFSAALGFIFYHLDRSGTVNLENT